MEIEIDFVSGRINITVSGAEKSQPSFAELVADLEITRGAPVDVQLKTIPSQLLTYFGTTAEGPD